MVIDFETEIYSSPRVVNRDYSSLWYQLKKEYWPLFDFDNNTKLVGIEYCKNFFFYEFPVYYINYIVASLGALQIYRNSIDDYDFTIRRLKDLIHSGGVLCTRELLDNCGIVIPFDNPSRIRYIFEDPSVLLGDIAH